MSFQQKTIILFLSIILCSQALGQNCLDYGEIDDPACTGLCGPAGWTNSGTAYIVEGDTYDSGTYDCSYNVPESPTGGTYQTLWDSNTGTIAGEIGTTITGLTPGTEYAFGFWAATPDWICGGVMTGGGIELSVTIDGETELVPTDIGWGLFEYCVTASSSSIDISFTVQETGFVGPALIDDAFCSDLNIQCCELAIDAEPNLETCPFEDLIFELDYENEVGNVDINWTSNPPSGLNFLDTSDPTQLIFNYDNSLSSVTQFVFTAEVSDDLCDLAIEIVVDITPYPGVTFDFDGEIFCSDYGEFILPPTSESGVEGVWDIPILFLQDHPGELLTLTFTTTDPSVACPTVTEHFLEVQEEIFSTFDFPLTYCRGQNDIIYFDNNSLEGNTGEWNPPLLELDLITDGVYNITFTPDESFCITGIELEIEIYSGDLIEFDLPDVICAGNTIYTFPTDNLNNVPGSWEFETMDLSDVTGSISNTFTANTIECYEDYEYTFEVLDELEITFDYPNNICSSDPTFSLPNTSIEGYVGQWSIGVIDPTTINGNIFTSTWTPAAGQSDCVTDTTIEIPVSEASTPSFTFPTELCNLDPLLIFPTISGENIYGSWSSISIDPQNGPSVIQNTFTPDQGQCAETITVEIEVTAAALPIFNLDTSLCVLDAPIQLPTLSDNNINGTWDISSIDPSTINNNQLTVTFTPDPTNNCVENLAINFNITDAIQPQFDTPINLCWSDNDFVLPDLSLEGIEGTWTTPIISPSDNIGQDVSSTFNPSNDSCSNPVVITISVLEPFDVNAQSMDPSDCEIMDGQIQLSGQLVDLEFSIDGGINWQSSESFTQLGAGFYEILVRSSINPSCSLILEANLDALQAPIITSITSTDIQDCEDDDGTITINIATNDIHEYSIDGGETWQMDPVFSDLSAGVYDIAVRNFGVDDCIVFGTATIEDFPTVEISLVSIIDVTDCILENGSLFIEATGIDTEFSIDGGTSWFSNPLFIDLPAGSYSIIVRSSSSPDCFATETSIIAAPGSPIINSITPSNTSTCSPLSGTINIEADSQDYLFSLDGANWQEENIFENLSTGDYNIYVQSLDNPTCITQGQTSIFEIEDFLPQADYFTSPPTECNATDASLSILINAQEIEFSIDQGNSWQDNPNFYDLTAGNYIVIIRKLGAPDCTSEFFVNIENPDCPCNNLQTTLIANNLDCYSSVEPSVSLLSAEGMENTDFTLQWQNGETSNEITNIEEGWQYLNIYYDEGCIWTDSIFIELPIPIEFDFIIENSECPEAENGSIQIINALGGNGSLSYGLNTSDFQEENLFENLAAGSYEIIVQDENGCLESVMIELSNNTQLNIELDPIQTFNLGDTIILNPQINEMAIDSFHWSPSTNILNPNELIAQIAPNSNITYELELFYGDCVERSSILLTLDESIQIFVPNIFNPSSDLNNYIIPYGNENIKLYRFSIYDRWGELIYAINDPLINNESQAWDGRFNGQLVNPGVFVYLLEYDNESKKEQKVGTITVVD